jgi:hypothetical protein
MGSKTIAVYAVGILIVLVCSCSSSGSGTKQVGAPGGPCTSGGACDPGLLCKSGVCVTLPDSSAPDAARDTQATTPPDGSGGVVGPEAGKDVGGRDDVTEVKDVTPEPVADLAPDSSDSSDGADTASADSAPDVMPLPDAPLSSVDSALDTGLRPDSSPDRSPDTTPDARGSGCLIDLASYAGGAHNISNPCQACVPAISTTAWTVQSDGTSCGTGSVCNAGTCAAGCFIASTYYARNALNPLNSCQACVTTTSTAAWTTSQPDGASCGSGSVCHGGACAAGCFIASMYYASSATNPSNSCQACAPATSTTAWTTSQPDGTSCGGGLVCNAGACGAGCFIASASYASGAPNPSNPCQVCVPAASTTAWTVQSDGTSCGSGSVCHGGTCGAGCFIASTYYASAAPNPSNACQSCAPAVSTTAWTTSQPDGTSCGTGSFCHGGACGAGCYIASTYYATNAPDPLNSCQTCVPATNTTAWTVRSDGASCGSGLVCGGGTCGAGCFINSTYYPSAAANPSNQCQTCVPATSTTTWTTSQPEGTSCEAGSVCHSGSCTPGCFIASKYYASSAANPSNPCQACAPATSTTTWTAQSDGAACGTCRFCSSGTCTVASDGASASCGTCRQCQSGACVNSPNGSKAPNCTATCVECQSGICTGTTLNGRSCADCKACQSGVCSTQPDGTYCVGVGNPCMHTCHSGVCGNSPDNTQCSFSGNVNSCCKQGVCTAGPPYCG